MAADTAARVEIAFRFLDLPKELRLMVYERTPVSTRHCVYYTYATDPACSSPKPNLTLVVKNMHIAIQRTSRFIYAESKAIFDARLQYLQKEPLRLIVNPHNPFALVDPATFWPNPSLWMYITELLHRLATGTTDRLPHWPPRYFKITNFSNSMHPANYWPLEIVEGTPEHLATIRFIEFFAKYMYARRPSRMVLCIRPRRPGRMKISVEKLLWLSARWASYSDEVLPALGVDVLEWTTGGVLGSNVHIQYTLGSIAALVNGRPRQFFAGSVEDDEWRRDWARGDRYD